MYTRNSYLKKIAPFINKPVVKVITGMRRVGKSYFMRGLIEKLKSDGINSQNLLYINKESIDFDFIKNYVDLHEFIKNSFSNIPGDKYLFIDEIQEIESWEKTIISWLEQKNIDIYITGSNARMLSSEIATLLSGRYIEFQLFSLNFKEFLLFRDTKKSDSESEFLKFLKFGGFPGLHHFDFDEEIIYQYVSSLFNTILLKDIVKRNHVRNIQLLEKITQYLFDNIGNLFSAKKVSDYIKSQNLQVGVDTVQTFISYIASTFAIHKVPRYDINGKRYLEINEKYYMGDIGLRHALLGYREADISRVLENIVFLELKSRGYAVSIGKLDNREIDFIIERPQEKCYIQVSYLLASPETVEREFNPLLAIQDNYPKYVLSMDTAFGTDIKGIKRKNIVDFLLDETVL